MSATEHLLVLYSGADPRTGGLRPPAVPIGELLDTVDQTVRTGDDSPPRDAVLGAPPTAALRRRQLRRRPTTPRSASTPPRCAVPEPHQGSAPKEPRSFRTTRCPAPGAPNLVAITDLVRFFQHPVKALLRDRGGLPSWDERDPITDELPVTLAGLEGWGVGDRMVTQLLQGADPDRLSGSRVAARYPAAAGSRSPCPG